MFPRQPYCYYDTLSILFDCKTILYIFWEVYHDAQTFHNKLAPLCVNIFLLLRIYVVLISKQTIPPCIFMSSIIRSIPLHLFIGLLTLPGLPNHVIEYTDWWALVETHLLTLGPSDDLPGFLDACLRDAQWAPGDKPPYWRTVRIVDDFEFLGGQGFGVTDLCPIGARIELLNTESRSKIPIQFTTPNPRYMFLSEQLDRTSLINRQGTNYRITTILTSTLEYVLHRATTNTTFPPLGPENEEAIHLLQQNIESIGTRIENNSRSILEKKDEIMKTAIFDLYAVLMKRENERYIADPEWDLYVRDYRGSQGNRWRRTGTGISKEEELNEQEFLDLLHKPEELSWSTSTTPWYLFYIDIDATFHVRPSSEISIPTHLPPSPEPDAIMLDKSSAKEGRCEVCHSEEALEGNDIFFCDDCNKGIHQYCQQPPIASEEIFRDPWYCLDCKSLRKKKLERKAEVAQLALNENKDGETIANETSSGIKRKRIEEHETRWNQSDN